MACGSGRHSYYLLGLGHSITAVDRNVANLTPLDRLEIIQHDLENGGPWLPKGRPVDIFGSYKNSVLVGPVKILLAREVSTSAEQ